MGQELFNYDNTNFRRGLFSILKNPQPKILRYFKRI